MPPAHPHGASVIFTLAAIAALGSLAIHTLVPALPLLAHDLKIGEAEAQLAISVYLMGLGAGQLIVGPAADSMGRKPVMMIGLACYIAGTAGAAFAPNLSVLIVARLIQALGGAAGVVTARVMVGDIFGEKEGAAKQATLMAVVLISPAFAPLLGGALADAFGWRAIMMLLCVSGVAATVMVSRLLPDIGMPHRHTYSRGAAWARLVRNRRFLLATGVLASSSSCLYMFLGASSFLLIHRFGLSAAETGVALLTVAAASVLGTQLVRRTQAWGDALSSGAGLAAVGAVGAVVCALFGNISAVAFIAPMTLLGVGAGLMGPTAITEIAFAEAGLAATATSLAGATQMLASACAISVLGTFEPLDPLTLSIALLCTSVAALCFSLSRRLLLR